MRWGCFLREWGNCGFRRLVLGCKMPRFLVRDSLNRIFHRIARLENYALLQNYVVPEVPLLWVKIHKNVHFSALDCHWLLKLHKSSGSNAVCTKMEEFLCWDTCKVLHYAQLKFDFFYNFVHFLGKFAAKFSMSLVLLPQ